MFTVQRVTSYVAVFFAFCLLSLCSVNVQAQVPEGINYQAVARDANNNPYENFLLNTVQFTIVRTDNSTVIYQEDFIGVQTNAFGLFNLVIGEGSNTGATSNSFSDIDWGSTSYSLRVEIDAGNGLENLGTIPFVSVPYALYAKEAGTVLQAGEGIEILNNIISNTGDGDSSQTNELVTALRLNGTSLELDQAQNSPITVDLSSLSAVSSVDTISALRIDNDELKIYSGDGDSVSVSLNSLATDAELAAEVATLNARIDLDNDTSRTNELQNLSLVGNGDTLILDNGQGQAISKIAVEDLNVVGTDDQQLTLNAAMDSILLEDGSGVDIAYITDSIASYNSRLNTNTTDIANNVTNIAVNTTNIATNTSDLSSLRTDFSADSLALQNHLTNDLDLSANNELVDSLDINGNFLRVFENGSLSDSLDITSFLSTGTDDQQLTLNAAMDSILLEDGSGVDIAYITDSIASYNSRLNTNATDIANNATNIAVNTTNISSNTSDLSTLRIDFSADSLSLETHLSNDLDLSANNELVDSLDINGNFLRVFENGSLSDSLDITSFLSTGTDDQQLTLNAAMDSILLEDGSGVDIAYITDSIASYNSRLNTNTTDIANNVTNIAANTTNIATNTSDLSSLRTDFSADSLALQNHLTNDLDLSANNELVDSLDINGNFLRVFENGSLSDSLDITSFLSTGTDDQQLTLNAAMDSILLEDGSGVDIAYITDSIASYNGRLNTNATDIANNVTNIAANTTNITNNTSDLSTLRTDFSTDSLALQNHLTNDLDLSANNELVDSLDINGNFLRVFENGSLSDSLDITSFLSTGTDDQQLTLNAAMDSILLEDGSGVDIAYITDSIASYNSRLNTNTTDIANNVTNIAVNTTNIATNTSDLSSLRTDFSADSLALQNHLTNDLDLSANNELVDSLDINGNFLRVFENGSLSDSLDITSFLSTGTDDQQLTLNAAMDSILLEDGSGVDIAYITDSIASYNSRLNTNTTDIANNVTNIAVNTTNIANNTSDLSTLRTDFSADSLSLENHLSNDLDLSANNELVDSLDINGNFLRVFENGSLSDSLDITTFLNSGTDDQQLTLNAAMDSILLEDGSGVDIAYITDSIANYNSRLNTNATDIANNVTNIAANTTNITNNTSDLSTLRTDFSADSLSLENHLSNDLDLSANNELVDSLDINGNFLRVFENGSLSDSLDITTFLNSGTDDQQLTLNAAMDSILLEDGSGVDIAYITDSIANYNSRLNTNATDIANNVTNIAANTTNITNNTSDLSRLRTDFSADSLSLENHLSNDLDLSANNELVDSLDINGNFLRVFENGSLSDSLDITTFLNSGTDDQQLTLNAAMDSILLEDGSGVDIAYITDSIANYNGRLNTNTTDIANNATNIAVNTTNIATNTSDLSSLRTDFSADSLALQNHLTNDLDLSANNELVDSLDINGNFLRVFENGSLSDSLDITSFLSTGTDDQQLTLNAAMDSILLEDGSGVDIAYITDSIANYNGRLNTNTTDIANNATNIAVNTTNIATNTSDLSSLRTDFSADSLALQNHLTNDLDLSANNELVDSLDINGNFLRVFENGSLSDSLDITSFLSTGTDDQQLTLNAAMDSILLEDGSGVDIAYITDSIASYNSRLNTNATDIANNTTSITANTANISSNTSDLSSLRIDFSTDSLSLETHLSNDLDLSANNELVDSLDINGNFLRVFENGSLSDSLDISSLSNSATFTTTSNITSNGGGDYTSDDFVFGSPSLDNSGTIAHDNRFFFNKAKGAFRAGTASGLEWNNSRLGNYSAAFGDDNQVSGQHSFAAGAQNTLGGKYSTALGQGGNLDASATHSMMMGLNNYIGSSGIANIAMGSGDSTNNIYSIAMGHLNSATGNRSLAIGSWLRSSGSSSFTIGTGINDASRIVNTIDNSLMIGFNSNSSTLFVSGGDGSLGSIGRVGIGTTAPDSLLTVAGGVHAKNIRLEDGAFGGAVLLSDVNGNASWGVLSLDVDTTSIRYADASAYINAFDTSFSIQTGGIEYINLNKEGYLNLGGFSSLKSVFLRANDSVAFDIDNQYSGNGTSVGIRVADFNTSGFGDKYAGEFVVANTSGINNYGIFSQASLGSDTNVAISGVAMGISGNLSAGLLLNSSGSRNNYGVHSMAYSLNSIDTAVGIYSSAVGTGLNYAAVFDVGNVVINDTLILPQDAGLGKVLTSDATGKARWQSLAGDNFGNHEATTNIKLNGNYLSNDGDNEGLRIDNFGNVLIADSLGIGTSSPAQKLHILDATGDAIVRLSTISGQRVGIQFAENDNVFNTGAIGFEAAYDGTNDALRFRSASSGTIDTLLTLSRTSGFVGVRRDNPLATLDVGGAIRLDSASAAAIDGMIQFTGSDFEGYSSVSGGWVSLTGASTCPTGMIDVNGKMCIELSERAALNWFDAAATCMMNGYKLPSWGEWVGAMRVATVAAAVGDETGNWEWVDNGTSNTASKVGLSTLKDIANGDPDTDSEAYRCVYYK